MSSFDAQSFYLAGVVPNNYMQRRGSTPPDSPTRIVCQPIDFVSSIPPSVTRLLTYCTPAIHLSFYLLKLVTWQSANGRESLLLLAAWWVVCLWLRELIVYGSTWILIAWIGWNWIQRRKRERLGKAQSTPLASSASSADLNRTLAELELVVDHIGVLHRAAVINLARLDWSDRTETEIILNMALYTYLPWLILAYLVPLRYMILLAGTFSISWSSPWMRVIRMAVARSAFMQYLMQTIIEWVISLGAPRGWRGIPSRQFSVRGLIQRAKEEQKRMLTGGARKTQNQEQEETKSEASGSKLKGTDLVFRFVIYENQRWWLGLDWTTNMMPNERGPWTDEYDEPTPHKSRFALPPPTYTITPHPTDSTLQIRKTMSWTWADPDWWPDMEANVDKEGWEYGHGGWKQYSSKSGSVQAYVRRRKWIRTAKLVERVEEIMAGAEKEKEDEGSSVEASGSGIRRKSLYYEEPEAMEGGGGYLKKNKEREGELKRRDSRKVISS